MSEEKEGPESGSEAFGAGIDPVATALALGGASREKADAFLDDQRVLIDEQTKLTRLQAQELSHELGLRHWSLWVRHASGLLKLALELSAGLLLLALAAGISLMVWNAAHADGLIIESFSVPPSLASRGVTGQVIATQVLDKLTVMQSETNSGRPAKSYANNWGDDIKVEIPDTGMSVGELYRFLRGWLGHETHISGEVTATPTGLAITARAGGNPGVSFTGAEADLDNILQQAAEHVYRSTQPYRYGIFLRSHNRRDEAIALFKATAEKGPAVERSYGYTGWTNVDLLNMPNAQRLRLLKLALALDPGNPIALNNLAGTYGANGDFEESYRLDRQVVALRGTDLGQVALDGDLGAYREAADRMQARIEGGKVAGAGNPMGTVVFAEIGAHDLSNARRNFPDIDVPTALPDQNTMNRSFLKTLLAFAAEDWAGVIAEAEATAPLRRKYPAMVEREYIVTPPVAYAKAKLGDIAGAEKLIAATPGDCYPCLRMRARIAQEAKAYARADVWFARAAAAAPSLPFAHAEWGQALLERGKPDEAIAQLKIANQKGPHFADPLEYWGEALMAKNQSHLALAKFKEADKYAPNWGRLHLKWGEALVYAGKRDEAKAQFARAAQLDLAPADKAALRNWEKRT